MCKSCFSKGIATINYDTLNKKINEKQRKREKYIEKNYRKK